MRSSYRKYYERQINKQIQSIEVRMDKLKGILKDLWEVERFGSLERKRLKGGEENDD